MLMQANHMNRVNLAKQMLNPIIYTLSSLSQLGTEMKQGDRLIPVLFAAYSILLIRIRASCKTIFSIRNACTRMFGYIDYVLLLAPSGSSKRHMLDTCEDFGVK